MVQMLYFRAYGSSCHVCLSKNADALIVFGKIYGRGGSYEIGVPRQPITPKTINAF